MFELIDPTIDDCTLLEYLGDAPQSIVACASGAVKLVLTHGPALVMSYHHTLDVRPFLDGAAEDCSEEQFTDYRDEVRHVAHQMVDDMQLF